MPTAYTFIDELNEELKIGVIIEIPPSTFKTASVLGTWIDSDGTLITIISMNLSLKTNATILACWHTHENQS